MPPPAHNTSDIPLQVFESFLIELEAKGIPVAKIARLRKTLIEEGKFSEQALRTAVMSEEPLP